ncbi:IclR family transcriptional regulator [Shumkonia mesophila]|uniref:IclR family transcriptional regulator n=1 Tax=Shumkonia mesophila TaxID=2838854 RepID=UPI00293487AE|nr:helix-turn-helix domain-containing protein [Shumkonia mesophila]
MRSESIRSVERIFEILELMDAEQRPLNMTEIVDWLGFPASSTAVLLRSMVALGYLHHDRSSRRYSPTVRLAHLGAWAGPHSLPDRRLLAAMREIRERTEQIVFLGHQNDIRVQYLHIEAGERAEEVVPKVGVTRLLVHSGLGLALMSLFNGNAVYSIIRRTNLILPEAETVDTEVVQSAIDACRTVGFVVSENTLRVGHGTLGIPVLVVGRQLAVGIGASVPFLHQSGGFVLQAIKESLLKHVSPDVILPFPGVR